jgi:hypothetical protein
MLVVIHLHACFHQVLMSMWACRLQEVVSNLQMDHHFYRTSSRCHSLQTFRSVKQLICYHS